ncbi:unnamed protein product [Dicrocoelium dendriticum]|nr:unnamed protein product [Dicrocoelium dendriticum]
MRLLLLPVSLLCWSLVAAVPIRSKYALEYELSPSPKLEKRLETEKESLVHLKEASKIDTDTEKREHQFINYDHFDEDDDFYGKDESYENPWTKHEQTHPKVEKLGQSQYQKKQAVRYEKRVDKQRELSQEVKHVPKFIKMVAHERYAEDDQYKYKSTPLERGYRNDKFEEKSDKYMDGFYGYDDHGERKQDKFDQYGLEIYQPKYGKVKENYEDEYGKYEREYGDKHGDFYDKYEFDYDDKYGKLDDDYDEKQSKHINPYTKKGGKYDRVYDKYGDEYDSAYDDEYGRKHSRSLGKYWGSEDIGYFNPHKEYEDNHKNRYIRSYGKYGGKYENKYEEGEKDGYDQSYTKSDIEYGKPYAYDDSRYSEEFGKYANDSEDTYEDEEQDDSKYGKSVDKYDEKFDNNYGAYENSHSENYEEDKSIGKYNYYDKYSQPKRRWGHSYAGY